uniref:Uncharacterized protein n=1 Tax=Clastoptera arizonana TaxID=38151 RepID=A0A1B6CRN2_9HEMI
MGRVRLQKNIVRKDFDENCEPTKLRKINANKSREKNSEESHKTPLKISTTKNNRKILSDKTNEELLSKISPATSLKNRLRNNKKAFVSPKKIKQLCVGSNNINSCNKLESATFLASEVSNSLSNKENRPVVPIYKQIRSSIESKRETLPLEKKLALYEFNEVDCYESTAKNKKKKRRNPKKKNYNIGPKYLKINNIKYSSSESINSLADNQPCRKQCKPKLQIQNKSSVVQQHSQSRNKCISITNCVSNPVLETSINHNYHANLSIIKEVENTPTSKSSSPITASDSNNPILNNSVNSSGCRPLQSYSINNNVQVSNFNSFGLKPFHEYSMNTSLPDVSLQDCSSGYNSPQLNVDEFETQTVEVRASTPSKIKTCIFQNLDKSRDLNIHKSKSFSTREISIDEEFYQTESLLQIEQDQKDDNFGFEEDEFPEEPLVSPIKDYNNSYRINKRCNKTDINKSIPPILSVCEIVQLLKAELGQEESTTFIPEESTEVSNMEKTVELSTASHNEIIEDTLSSFVKPPRRSYQRRCISHYSFERVQENSEDEEIKKEIKPKAKRKQKIKIKKEWCTSFIKFTQLVPYLIPCLQEDPSCLNHCLKIISISEIEANKLAEQLNSKFEEIDKFILCVE